MLLDDVIIEVTNRDNGSVGYSIEDLNNLHRNFMPNETKKITMGELRKLAYTPGGEYLLTNCLKLNNDDAIDELIGKVEIEYYYDEDKIKDLLTNGSIDEFLDCLDFAPDGVIDLVKNLAVTLKLNDYAKREAIFEKTGFDVTKAIEINKATEEIKQEKTNTTRRVKEEAQEVTEKPVRRTLSSTKK